MKKKRFLSLLLCLLLGLTACGDGGSGAKKLSGEIVYVPETIDIDCDFESVEGSCVSGGWVYILGQADERSLPEVVRVSPEDGAVEALPEYKNAGESYEGDCSCLFGSMQAGMDGTIWVTEYLSVQGELVNGEFGSYHMYRSIYLLRHLDADGKELSRRELDADQLQENLEELNGSGAGLGEKTFPLLVDGDGTVYIRCENGIAALDDAGEISFYLIPEQNLQGSYSMDAVVLGDGRVAAGDTIEDEDGNDLPVFRPIDKEAMDWAEDAFVLPDNLLGNYYDGDAGAAFYSMDSSHTFYACRAVADGMEPLCKMMDYGIDCKRVYCAGTLDGGKTALLISLKSWSDSPDGMSIVVLTPTDASQIKEKKTLTYAAFSLGSDQVAAISRFNRTSEDYRVTIVDYGESGRVEEARTRFITEIGAGKIPDLIDSRLITSLENWAAKGYLENLWPYIESDPELGREALMERPLVASEVNGGLYELSEQFSIDTLTGAKSVVGDRMTWTKEDMMAAMEKMPDGSIPVNWSRSEILIELVGLDLPHFIDSAGGTCSFDSDEYRDVLEFCAAYPDVNVPHSYMDAYARTYDGQQMLLSHSLNFEFPQHLKFFFHDDISYVGTPNPWGKVGSKFTFPSGVAMASACQDKDGAWAFLRTLVLPHTEEELRLSPPYNFPVNKADFQTVAEIAMTPEYKKDRDGNYVTDAFGDKIETSSTTFCYDGIDEGIPIYAMTQEEYDQIMELYNSTETFSRWADWDLDEIISDSAGAYFAGDRSLDDTAALTQSRVELYLGEQK